MEVLIKGIEFSCTFANDIDYTDQKIGEIVSVLTSRFPDFRSNKDIDFYHFHNKENGNKIIIMPSEIRAVYNNMKNVETAFSEIVNDFGSLKRIFENQFIEYKNYADIDFLIECNPEQFDKFMIGFKNIQPFDFSAFSKNKAELEFGLFSLKVNETIYLVALQPMYSEDGNNKVQVSFRLDGENGLDTISTYIKGYTEIFENIGNFFSENAI